jgi:tetratricopeptide (TPR) repeat protein
VAEKEESKFGVDTNELLKFAVGGFLLFVARWLISYFHLLPDKPAKDETFPTPDQLATGIACFLWLLLVALLVVLKRWRNSPKHVRGTVESGKIAIWVDELEEDTAKREHRNHIIDTLEVVLGDAVQIVRADCCLKTKEAGNVKEDTSAAFTEATDYFRRHRGDLIIWGRVSGSTKSVLNLHFFSADGDNTKGNFALTDTLTLDAKFGSALATALSARVVSAIKSGKLVADTLEPLAEKLDELAGSPPESMNDEQRATVLFGCAVSAATIGEQKKQSKWLYLSVNRYERLIEKYRTREKDPDGWAVTQNNLGIAYQSLAEHGGGPQCFKKAEDAHRAALDQFALTGTSLDRAEAQWHLGTVLLTLGELDTGTTGTARLKEAELLYDEVLKKWAQPQFPLQWAAVQQNLGVVFLRLGQREESTEYFDKAMRAFHAALKERTRELFPLDWAMTTDNLSSALSKQGELELKKGSESGKERLKQALQAYGEALEERTRERVPLEWAATQNNLGDALITLGRYEKGTEHFEKAVHACSLALEEGTPTAAPYLNPVVQENLDHAMRLLEERRTGISAAIAE